MFCVFPLQITAFCIFVRFPDQTPYGEKPLDSIERKTFGCIMTVGLCVCSPNVIQKKNQPNPSRETCFSPKNKDATCLILNAQRQHQRLVVAAHSSHI